MSVSIDIFSAVPTTQRFVNIGVQVTDATSLTVRRRRQDGEWVIVRGAHQVPIDVGGWVGYDYEAPQGRLLTYEARATDGVTEAVAEVTMSRPLDYGGDWLMPVGRWEFGMNIFVEFGGVGEMEHRIISDSVSVLGRLAPVSVSWGRMLRRGTITFLTMDDLERRAFERILSFPVIMFAARHGFGYDDPAFFALNNVFEERPSGLGSETARRWVVEVQEIERPPAEYTAPAPAVSWQTLLDGSYIWEDFLPDSWYEVAGYP